MIREPTFTAEQLLAEANKHGDHVADMLTYAATLRQQAARVDEESVRGWNADNLERCCIELTNLINLAGDYDFDEMTEQTFQTAIECIRVCQKAALSAQPAERQGVVHQYRHKDSSDWYDGVLPSAADRDEFETRTLYTRPAAPVGVPDAPLSVFSKGGWTYSGTGQSFDEKAMDEAAFVAYRDYFAAAPSAPQGVECPECNGLGYTVHPGEACRDNRQRCDACNGTGTATHPTERK